MPENEIYPADKTKKSLLPRVLLLAAVSLLFLGALAYVYYFNPTLFSNNFQTKPNSNSPIKTSSAQNGTDTQSLIGGGAEQIANGQPIKSSRLLETFQNKLEKINNDLQTLEDKTSLAYLKGKLNINEIKEGDVEITDNLILNSTAKTESIIPQSDDNYNLGSEDKGWDNAYIHTLYGSSILTVGDGETSHILNNKDDLLVSGNLEVNGNSYFDSDVVFGGTINGIISSGELGFLNGVTSEIQTQFSDLNINIDALDTAKQDALSSADTDTSGYLTYTDWNTFNNKQNAITPGTSLQYYTGEKTWATLNQAAVDGLKITNSPTFAGMTLSSGGMDVTGASIFNDGVDFLGLDGVDITNNLGVGGDIITTGNADVGGNLIVSGTSTLKADSATVFRVQDASANDYIVTDSVNGGTIFYNPHANIGGETASTYTIIQGPIVEPTASNATIKNGRSKILLDATASGGNNLVTVTSQANTFIFNNDNPVTVGSFNGVTIRPNVPQTGAEVNMDSFAGFITGASGSGGGVFNATNVYGLKVEDWDTNIEGVDIFPGTQANMYGIYIDKQISGETKNVGIALAGDDYGADVSYGATGQLRTYRDATSGDFVLNGGKGIIYAGTTDAAGVAATRATKKEFYAKTLSDVEPSISIPAITITSCSGSGDQLMFTGSDVELMGWANGQSFIVNNAICSLSTGVKYYVCSIAVDRFKVDDNSNCGSNLDLTGNVGQFLTATNITTAPMTLPVPTTSGQVSCHVKGTDTVAITYLIGNDGSVAEVSDLGGKALETDTCTGATDGICIYDNVANAVVVNDLGQAETFVCEFTYD